MTILEEKCGAVTVLKPVGPLIGDDAAEFGNRLMGLIVSSLGRCVVDASEVPLLDSKALDALADANDKLAESGHSLRLCGENETVRQVLELTDLAELFEHYEDVNSAVRSFL